MDDLDYQRKCLHCGKPEKLWQDYGLDINDQGYCCRGCAEDYICNCGASGFGGDRIMALDFDQR